MQWKRRPVRSSIFLNEDFATVPSLGKTTGFDFTWPLELVTFCVRVRASCKQQGASLQDLIWPRDWYLQSIPWFLQLEFAYKQH